MDIFAQIESFSPACEQERRDQALILRFAHENEQNVLTRANEIAHITCSGFIMNASLSRMLLIHHNILGCWAWTGGHADGETDFLAVALREAKEETGALHISPLDTRIATMDILTVGSHIKNGRYVNAHLHLNVAYLLICDENDALSKKPDENSGVQWFDTAALQGESFSSWDKTLYGKLITKARRIADVLCDG